MPIYITPFSLLVLTASIPLGIFVGIFAVKQTGLIAHGITTKQLKSIMITKGYQQQSSFKVKLCNIFDFLMKRKPDSLVDIRL
jgi:hypothetical protein